MNRRRFLTAVPVVGGGLVAAHALPLHPSAQAEGRSQAAAQVAAVKQEAAWDEGVRFYFGWPREKMLALLLWQGAASGPGGREEYANVITVSGETIWRSGLNWLMRFAAEDFRTWRQALARVEGIHLSDALVLVRPSPWWTLHVDGAPPPWEASWYAIRVAPSPGGADRL